MCHHVRYVNDFYFISHYGDSQNQSVRRASTSLNPPLSLIQFLLKVRRAIKFKLHVYVYQWCTYSMFFLLRLKYTNVLVRLMYYITSINYDDYLVKFCWYFLFNSRRTQTIGGRSAFANFCTQNKIWAKSSSDAQLFS
jgi:hypothetical protein